MLRDRGAMAREWERWNENKSPIKHYLDGPRFSTSVYDHVQHVTLAIRNRGQLWPGNDRTALDAYYIGVSTRTPHARWTMQTEALHCSTYRSMVVLSQSTASACRDVESAAINRHIDSDRLCRNRGAGGGGVARGSHNAFVYICIGPAWQPGAAPLLRRR